MVFVWNYGGSQGLQALSITDHEAFRELLIYNGHNKTKELDIPHRTQVTDSILDRAAEIQAHIAKELQVGDSTLFLQLHT